MGATGGEVMDQYIVSPLTPLNIAFKDGGSHVRAVVEDGKTLGILLMRDILGHHAAGRDIHKMAASDAMISDFICMQESGNHLQAARLFADHKIKSLLISDHHGCFLRNIDAPEVIQSLPSSLLAFFQTASNIMTHNPVLISADATLQDANEKWLLYRISCLIVCNDENIALGILSESDVLRWILDGSHASNLADYMSSSVITMDQSSSVRQVWDMMLSHHIMKIVMTDTDGKVSGLVTATDVLVSLCQSLLDTFSCYHCPDDVDLMMEWRKDGMVMAVSQRVLDCFGMSSEECIGLSWQDGCKKEDINALLCLGRDEQHDLLWEIDGAALPFVVKRDTEQAIMWWRLK